MSDIEVQTSPIEGRGVFATRDFDRREKVELCELIEFPLSEQELVDKTEFFNYYFDWGDTHAIALGNGSLYNHSYEPNAYWMQEDGGNRMVFMTRKRIKKGEEITVNYNGDPTCQDKVWFDK